MLPIKSELFESFGGMVVRVAMAAVKTVMSRADGFLGQFEWYSHPWN